MVTPVHHQTQLIPTTTPRKAIATPTRVVKALERKIIHQMLKAMVLGELSSQDLGEGSTTSTITEIRFMFRSNKMRSIFLLALLLPLGMNAYAEVLTPICINSIQSRQFQEKVVKLQRQNATFMSAVEAVHHERSTLESFNAALTISLILTQVSESLQLIETTTSLFPLLKFNNQDQITINFFGKRNTYTRESLKKIYEVLLQGRVERMSSAKDQIMNFSQGVKNLSLLRDINEMSTIIDELDKLLKPCK